MIERIANNTVQHQQHPILFIRWRWQSIERRWEEMEIQWNKANIFNWIIALCSSHFVYRAFFLTVPNVFNHCQFSILVFVFSSYSCAVSNKCWMSDCYFIVSILYSQLSMFDRRISYRQNIKCNNRMMGRWERQRTNVLMRATKDRNKNIKNEN